jgi:tetratricopeptide (TPR) repeat protein
LETIREFGLERLAQRGETAEVRRLHAAFYLDLAREAEPQLYGREQARWLDRLETEQPNLRAVLAWAVEAGDAEAGLRLAGHLFPYWARRSRLSEGRAWLDQLLGLADRGGETCVSRSARAAASRQAGHLANWQADQERAELLAGESLRLYRELDDANGAAQALGVLGLVARDRGEYAVAADLHARSLALFRQTGDAAGGARAMQDLGVELFLQGETERAARSLEESLSLWRQQGDTWSTAQTLAHLSALTLERGDLDRAESLIEESLALRRSLGNTWGIAQLLNNLALVAHARGDLTRALELAGEGVTLFRETGDRRGTSSTLDTLGEVLRDQGDLEGAERAYREGLELARAIGHKRNMAAFLERLGTMAVGRGHAALAARLYGAAEAVRDGINCPVPPIERAGYDRAVALMEGRLGGDAFGRAWSEGRSMPLQRAVDLALRS